MMFLVMLSNGERMALEADGWAEVAKSAELTFGRANLRMIYLRDNGVGTSSNAGIERMARERYATEKLVQAYSNELAVKQESEKAYQYYIAQLQTKEKS